MFDSRINNRSNINFNLFWIMRHYHTDFDPNKPYKVVAVSKGTDVKYKITQPLNFWLFGFTVRYYDVCQWALRSRYKQTKYFKDKKEVDKFVEENTKIIEPGSEIVVFDSLRELPSN